MESFIVLMVWTALIIKHRNNNKSVVSLIFFILFFPFTISIGSSRVNALYYACILFGLMVLMKSKRKIRIDIFHYTIGLVGILFVYVIGWVINGMGTFFNEFIGDIKFVVIIIEIALLVSNIEYKDFFDGIMHALNFAVIVNFIIIIVSQVKPLEVINIVNVFFYNDDTLNASSNLIGGKLTRAFGVYNHPAVLAIFCLVAISFYLVELKYEKKCIIYLAMCIVMGVLAYSKTFLLGLPINIFVYILFNLKRMNNPKWGILLLIMLVAMILVIINFEFIITKVSLYNPVLGYYLKYLISPLDALSTRYNMKSGNLASMYGVIKEHFIIGVGPNSIKGELVLDSAPLVILHNGGIMALLFSIVINLKIFLKAIIQKQELIVLLMIVLVVSGFALPTWIYHMATLPIVIYSLVGISYE